MAQASNTAPRPSEMGSWSAVQLSRAIKSRQVSCRDVMSHYLAQIASLNPAVNAIVSMRDPDFLLRQADARDDRVRAGTSLGWMHGFPHAPKDLASTSDIPTTQGSPIFRNFTPKRDAFIVDRIRRSGAVLIGKTNVPEFGLGSQTYNPVFGVTRNAFDQSKCAGGSSGGAAVALALRMVPVADGSDMMGSLRNPAGWNNVFSLRPSLGRVPFGPTNEVFLNSIAYEGPMGRSVGDVAMLLSVMAGYHPDAPSSIDQDPLQFTRPLGRDFRGVRVGWMGDYNGYLPTEPGIMTTCRKALSTFETIGCTVEEVQPDFAMDRLWRSWLVLRGWLIAGVAGGLYKDPKTRAMMKPEAIWEIESGLRLSGPDVYQASIARTAWYLALRKLFEHYEYLVLPSAQVFPFDANLHWPTAVNGKPMDTYHRWMEVVIGGSLSGVPIITVPAGFGPTGLPIGLQVMGRPRCDFAALQIGEAYEQASGVAGVRSPLLSSI